MGLRDCDEAISKNLISTKEMENVKMDKSI